MRRMQDVREEMVLGSDEFPLVKSEEIIPRLAINTVIVEEVMRVALRKYRAWIGRRDGDEDYVTFRNATELAAWLMKDWPTGYWGIEKYDNDSWVDAFYSDDIVNLVCEIKGMAEDGKTKGGGK